MNKYLMGNSLRILVGCLAIGLMGCQQQDNKALVEKLTKMEDRIDSLSKLADKPQRAPARKAQRPDGNTIYSMPVHPFNPIKGPKQAKVTVVKGFEFACGYCRKAVPTMDKILETYKDDVRIVYKQSVLHPNTATVPALASCAAGLQGKFSEFEKRMWDDGFPKRKFGQETMDAYAKEIGLDMNKYKVDSEGPCKKYIAQDRQELVKLNARGTPAFFINGRFVSGARPFEAFKTVIDQELAKANKAIASGTSLANYYDSFVVKKGKKTL